MKYGLWTIIKIRGSKVLCSCECGTQREVNKYDLKQGKTKSCGCSRYSSKQWRAANDAKKTHGMTKSSEYRIWVDMIRRCHKPNRPDYHRYGGRGISVCKEWRESFENFYRDMGPKPYKKFLERKDNEGNYNKQNCIWADKKTQARNTRTNKFVEIDGKRMTLIEVAEYTKVNYGTLQSRLKRGWDLKRAINPIREVPSKIDRITKNSIIIYPFGEKLTLSQAARKYNLTNNAVEYRYHRGWSHEDIVTKPMRKVRLKKS